MQTINPTARGAIPAQIAGYAAAAGVSWHALGGAIADSAAAPLFGWQRLIVVHVLLALPLAVFVAVIVRNCVATARPLTLALAAAAIGLAATFVMALIVPFIGNIVESGSPGAWILAPVRTLLCLAVELPWCVAIACSFKRHLELQNRSAPATSFRELVLWTSIAVGAAIALPAVFINDLIGKQTVLASDLLARQQLVAADRVIARLCAAGSNRPLRGAEPTTVRRKLARTIRALEQRVDRANPAAFDAQQTIELARTLAMLDRAAAAQELLEPLAGERADAALLLAATLQEQQIWEASLAQFASAARLLRDMPDSAQRTAGLVQAIDGIAFCERELGRFREAQQSYEAGLRELPNAAAHFHFQLARHHQLGGRPTTAMAHLQQAATLDPQGYGSQSAALIRQLAAGSPGCLLGPSAVGK